MLLAGSLGTLWHFTLINAEWIGRLTMNALWTGFVLDRDRMTGNG